MKSNVQHVHVSNLQEILELCGRVDEVRQTAFNLGLLTRAGALTEQLGAVVLQKGIQELKENEKQGKL